MATMRASKIVLMLAALTILGDGARAGEDEGLHQKRIVTRRWASSNCIGDPRTPICAVDTLYACIIRRNPALCAIVGVKDPCFGDRNVYAQYVIDEIRPLKPENIKAELKSYLLDDHLQGDGYATVIYHLEICLKGNTRCGRIDGGGVETLRLRNSNWTFTSFPFDADRCGPEPD